MANASLVNFAAGETSPKSRGRFDIAAYNSSCRKLENFIAEVQGSARYRPGFRHVERVRERVYGTAGPCRIIPYQVNGGASYMLEFTPGKLRIYRNGALETVSRTTVTGLTDAVVGSDTYLRIDVNSSTGLAAPDEVIISGVVGATKLNGRVLRLWDAGSNQLWPYDPLTSTNWGPGDAASYVSGGTVTEVLTIASPYYTQEDLDALNFAQTPSAMYLACYRHPPYKLTVDTSTGTWTLATYSRTNDPLAAGAAINITNVYVSGGKTYVTLASAAVSEHLYTIASVTGTIASDVNAKWRFHVVENVGGSPTYEIRNATTDDSFLASGAYTSGGTATPDADNPIAVAFFESRLVFAGTNVRPNTLFMSRSPVSTTGATRYDDFTGGTDADHACFFTLAPTNGQIDYITWAVGTAKYLVVGAFGGAFRVSGGGLDEPITPTSINVRPVDSFGCAPTPPAVNGAYVYFVQRGGVTVRVLKYSADADDIASFDLCLNSEQIGYSPITRIVFQPGRPDMLWVLRTDGQMASMTLDAAEQIAGWHRHIAAGTSATFIDMAVLPRQDQPDQLWVITQRTVPGIQKSSAAVPIRSVEYLTDDVTYSDIEDYYGTTATEALDAAAYRAATVALLKTAAFLDASEYYNGSAAATISGIWHLEGETVTAVADGVEVSGLVVTNGAITLSSAASVVHVGLPYTGLLQTQNLELGGRSGPAQAKPRNICALNIRFLNSKGGKYGTDLYHLYDIDTEDPAAWKLADGSAAPLFNGVRTLSHFDNWSTENDRNEKTVFVVQDKPFPCVVQFIDIEYDTGDE